MPKKINFESATEALKFYPEDKMFDVLEVSEILGVSRGAVLSRIGRANRKDGYYLPYLVRVRTSKGAALAYYLPKGEMLRIAGFSGWQPIEKKKEAESKTQGRDGLENMKGMVNRWVSLRESVSDDLLKKLGIKTDGEGLEYKENGEN